MFPSPFHGNPVKHEKDLFNKQERELHYRLLMRMAKKGSRNGSKLGIKRQTRARDVDQWISWLVLKYEGQHSEPQNHKKARCPW